MLDLRIIGVLARPDNDAFAGIANIQNAGTWDMVPCQYAFRSGFKEISHFVNFGRVENQLVREVCSRSCSSLQFGECGFGIVVVKFAAAAKTRLEPTLQNGEAASCVWLVS